MTAETTLRMRIRIPKQLLQDKHQAFTHLEKSSIILNPSPFNMTTKPLRLHRPLPNLNPFLLGLNQLHRSIALLRHLVPNRNDSLMRTVDVEVRVQVLERPLHGLRIEKVHDGEKEEVEGREDDVESIADGFNPGGGELRAHEAEEPVRRSGGGSTASPHSEGILFRSS